MNQPTVSPTSDTPERIGLLAAWGRFPIIFAEAAKRQGHQVHCIGVSGMASDELGQICDSFVTVPLGRIGKVIRLLKRARVNNVVMAGKIEKRKMYHPLGIFRFLPDWRALHIWYQYVRENKADDTIMLAVVREFARDGLTFASQTNYCPELLVDHGFLTRKKPSSSQWRDIQFGWEVAKEMGRLDIGQSNAVNNGAIIAVEAIEGTDGCIQRAGTLCRRQGFTVVKVAKPQQDLRFDVPAVGVKTIQTMNEAGARVLAIESEKTILLDKQEVIELANKLGISIVALNAVELELRAFS